MNVGSWRRYRAAEQDQETAAPVSWRQTLAIVWVAEFVAVVGFAVVIPFLPFYVQELGVSDPDEVKLWSGLVTSAQAITMAIFAPIWGGLADRYGRKLMLERAMFGGSILLTLMGFAQNPQQLVILRAIQGCLTGTVAAATTLVASTVPRKQSGFAMGLLQMGIFSGVSVGPLVGGLIADNLGYQAAFMLTGACLFVAGLGVMFFVQERFEPPAPQSSGRRGHFWDGLVLVVRSRELLLVFGARLLTRIGNRVINPILPLFVATLVVGDKGLNTLTGTVTAASAVASAIGAAVLGQASDRLGHRRVLLASSVVAAVFYVLQAAVTNTAQLIALQFCVGVAMAGTLASLAAMLATLAPEGQQGAVYGVDTSVVAGANAIAPMMGAALAVAMGYRATFLLAAGVFALAALVIGLLIPAQPTPGDEVGQTPQ